MPRLKKGIIQLQDNNALLDPTSSLNKHFMCICKRLFKYKSILIVHVNRCPMNINRKEKVAKNNKRLKCDLCKLEFKNMGNLMNHRYYIHGYKKEKICIFKCDVCEAAFSDRWKVRFHIRRAHFNLLVRIPHSNTMKINQVWYEQALNTDLVMQIRKLSNNRLIMKPIPFDKNLEIYTINRKIDLRDQYTFACKTEQCKFCNKDIIKRDMKKHMNETHLNVTKHKCNNCQQTFKRSYKYLQHVCNKSNRKLLNRINGVRHGRNSSIRISSVGTLKQFL